MLSENPTTPPCHRTLSRLNSSPHLLMFLFLFSLFSSLCAQWAAGVKPSEVMISHVLTQLVMLIIQIGLLLLVAVLVFKIPCHGSILTIMALTVRIRVSRRMILLPGFRLLFCWCSCLDFLCGCPVPHSSAVFFQVPILFCASFTLLLLSCSRSHFPSSFVHSQVLLGMAGMLYGLFLSSICADEQECVQYSTGSFFPVMLLSGILWPVEGIPGFLRYMFTPNMRSTTVVLSPTHSTILPHHVLIRLCKSLSLIVFALSTLRLHSFVSPLHFSMSPKSLFFIRLLPAMSPSRCRPRGPRPRCAT
jgi:hypothetical protein